MNSKQFRESFELQKQMLQDNKTKCDHDFKTFKQTIQPDNDKYIKGRAYFIVKACLKCHEKRTLDYKVEL